jgi:pimeloyl-ACP methyl ester carboxylesterase
MSLTQSFIGLSTGVTVPYVEQGDRQGLPVIFLHGYMDSWRALEGVLNFLPPDIHAYAFSQRGHGDADKPLTGYQPEDFALDLLSFMDSVNVDATVIVGASSGGLAALSAVLNYPERILGFVLAGAPVTLKGNKGVLAFYETVCSLTDPIDRSFVQEFQQSTLEQPVAAEFLDALVDEALKVVEADDSARLSEIEVPTLIVSGGRDHILPPPQQKVVASAIKTSTLLIYERAGHTFYWEEPARFAGDLVLFCRHLRGDRGLAISGSGRP